MKILIKFLKRNEIAIYYNLENCLISSWNNVFKETVNGEKYASLLETVVFPYFKENEIAFIKRTERKLTGALL